MTKEQIGSTLLAVAALAEAIRTLGEIPSGHLYAQVCGELDMTAYQSAIATLKRAGLVAERNHLLTWVGPEIAS